jgi:hypothetical protein
MSNEEKFERIEELQYSQNELWTEIGNTKNPYECESRVKKIIEILKLERAICKIIRSIKKG